MLKARWVQTLQLYLLCVVAFAISMPYIVGAVSIILLLASWLLGVRSTNFKNLLHRPALWFWLLYFALHAISYTYSYNKEQSLFDLQAKISFVILPLVIGTSDNIDKKSLERIFLSFLAGVSVVALFTVGRAVGHWLQTQETEQFFYDKLIGGWDANAVNYAWYTLFSISILLLTKWEYYFQKAKLLKLLIILFQIAFLVLLSSRTLIALLFVLIFPYYFLKGVKSFSLLKASLISIAITILATLIITTENPIKERYKNIFNVDVSQAFMDDYHGVMEGSFSNLTVRLFFWRLGVENLNKYDIWAFGAGNGDVSRLQNDRMHYYGMNMYPPVEEWHSPFFGANLHNMFMQTLMMIGLVGLTVFIIIVFMPYYYLKYISHRDTFILFHLIAFAFMMQEAALQSQAGIIFFTFFSQLFWANVYRGKQLIKR